MELLMSFWEKREGERYRAGYHVREIARASNPLCRNIVHADWRIQRVHADTANPCIYLSSRSRAHDIHFKRNCSGLSLFRKGPGCGRSASTQTDSNTGRWRRQQRQQRRRRPANPRPDAFDGSHKLNTNWHTRGAPVVFHAFNFHRAGHCV